MNKTPETVDVSTDTRYIVDMSTHTYTVTRTNTYDWTGNPDDVFYVACNCGIASGMSHATVKSAHREPIHTNKRNSNRRIAPAVWDGRIVDDTAEVSK